MVSSCDGSLEARKRRLRARIRAGFASPGAAEAAAVCENLTGLEEFRRARCVALFASLPDEVSTRPVFDASRRAGKRRLLPRVTGTGELEFAEVERWEDLRPGRYGVPEPTAAGSVALSAAELVVVPGVAFDACGGRLGRGGGHYDRALARLDRSGSFLVGVALAAQVVDAVPTGSHDQRVDAVVTEREVLRGWAE